MADFRIPFVGVFYGPSPPGHLWFQRHPADKKIPLLVDFLSSSPSPLDPSKRWPRATASIDISWEKPSNLLGTPLIAEIPFFGRNFHFDPGASKTTTITRVPLSRLFTPPKHWFCRTVPRNIPASEGPPPGSPFFQRRFPLARFIFFTPRPFPSWRTSPSGASPDIRNFPLILQSILGADSFFVRIPCFPFISFQTRLHGEVPRCPRFSHQPLLGTFHTGPFCPQIFPAIPADRLELRRICLFFCCFFPGTDPGTLHPS